MNHTCNGDWLRYGGRVWYRCFLDSTVLRGIRIDRLSCPRCGRRIDAKMPARDNAARMTPQLRIKHPGGDGYLWVSVAPADTVRADRREARA